MNKSPYRSLWVYLLPLPLTILAAFAVTPLKEGKMDYFYSIINERGPVIYMILYVLFSNAMAMIVARNRSFLPKYFYQQFVVFSWFPVGFGVLGTMLGFGSVVAGFSQFMAQTNSMDHLNSALIECFVGFGVAFDPLLLGTLCTIISFSFYAAILRANKPSEEPPPAT